MYNFKRKIVVIFNCLFLHIIIAKIYPDYASFDGCEPFKNCKVKTITEKLKYFAKGLSNSCLEKKWDSEFLICLDRYFLCGYLPLIYYKNSTIPEINKESGIIIANGLDLGKMNEEKLKLMGVPNILVDKLKPYFGKKGQEAYNLILNTKINITENEAQTLDFVYKSYYYDLLKNLYDNQTVLTPNCTQNFDNLPIGIKTVLISIFRNTGDIKLKDLWLYVSRNDWIKLAEEIKIIYGSMYRRKLESLIVDSINYRHKLLKLNKPIYTSFVIDFSQMTEENFNHTKHFIVKLLDNYTKTENLHSNSIIIFYDKNFTILSNFTPNVINSLADLTNFNFTKFIKRENSTTERNIGLTLEATSRNMEKIIQNKTLNISSFYNVLLLTTGRSVDSITDISNKIRNDGVDIIAIGADYGNNEDELIVITGSKSNILNSNNLSWGNLSCYENRLLNNDIYENKMILPGERYESNSTNIQRSDYYYIPNLDSNQNLAIRVNITKLTESAKIKIYISYTDPYPNKYTYDYQHLGRNVNNATKFIVVPGNKTIINNTNNEAAPPDPTNKKVFITVEGGLDSNAYLLELFYCDPHMCEIGANENDDNETFTFWLFNIILATSVLLLILFIVFLINCYKKKRPKIQEIQTEKTEVTSDYNKLTNNNLKI